MQFALTVRNASHLINNFHVPECQEKTACSLALVQFYPIVHT